MKSAPYAPLGALLCLVGCASDGPGTGTVLVPYTLGNHKPCEEVGVTRVRATLNDGVYQREIECDGRMVRFDEVMPGSYTLDVFGLDDDGIAVLDSAEHGPHQIEVGGLGEVETVDPAITLTETPAKLQVRWNFGFGNCGLVDRFHVTAWKTGGSRLLLEHELDCALPGEGSDRYRTVPDEQRALNGDELGEVGVQPLDMEGYPLGEAALFRFHPPGAGRTVKLSLLECDDTGCTSTGVPDGTSSRLAEHLGKD